MSDTFTRDRFAWLDQVASDPALLPITFRTAYIIARHMNRQTGEAWPSLDTLAAALSVTNRTVIRSVNELCSAGYLQKRRGGFGKSNRYELAYPHREQTENPIHDTSVTNGDVSHDTSVTNGTISSDMGVTSVVTPVSPQSCHRCHTNSLNEPFEIEPIEKDISPLSPLSSVQERTRQEDNTAFDEFWQSYPKRVDKGAARKAWAKAMKGKTSPATIIAATKEYAAERRGQDAKFTKHPATWLNAESWLNERPPASAITIDQDGNRVMETNRPFEHHRKPDKAKEYSDGIYNTFGLEGRS